MSSQEPTEASHGCLWQAWNLGHCPVCAPNREARRVDPRPEPSGGQSKITDAVNRFVTDQSKPKNTWQWIRITWACGTTVHELVSLVQWLMGDPLGSVLWLWILQ